MGKLKNWTYKPDDEDVPLHQRDEADVGAVFFDPKMKITSYK